MHEGIEESLVDVGRPSRYLVSGAEVHNLVQVDLRPRLGLLFSEAVVAEILDHHDTEAFEAFEDGRHGREVRAEVLQNPTGPVKCRQRTVGVGACFSDVA